MRRYKASMPYDVAMKILIPVETKTKGVVQKVFPPVEEGILFYGSFRTFGGSENTSNDLYMVYDTATIDTWYRPDITPDCRIYICETDEIYEVVGRPENIGMRHQYMQFKVIKAGGKS